MFKLNLAAVKAEVKRKLHNDDFSDAQLELWCNLTQDYIWCQGDFKSATTTTTFDTVADTGTYFIDANIGRILSMTNVTQSSPMEERSERELELADPARDTTGTASVYSTYGKSEVHYQLAAAGKIKVVSSSTADSTQLVRIIGSVSGVETVEEIDLNGTTAATGSSTFVANSIVGVRLDATCAGNITVTDTSDVEIVVIPIGKLFKMYTPVNLFPIPSADDDEIRVRYIQGPRPMISDSDIPDLPPEYHRLVLLGTLAQAHDEMYEFDESEKLYSKLDKDILQFKKMDNSIRGVARSVRSRDLRRNRSGGPWGTLPPEMDT